MNSVLPVLIREVEITGTYNDRPKCLQYGM
jgi:hypothetical protein